MIFLKGTIDDNLQPLVDDVFVVSEEANIPVTVILDTGFNGECCLLVRYHKTSSNFPQINIKLDKTNNKNCEFLLTNSVIYDIF